VENRENTNVEYHEWSYCMSNIKVTKEYKVLNFLVNLIFGHIR
jgi:hypothetical protein